MSGTEISSLEEETMENKRTKTTNRPLSLLILVKG